MVRILPDKCQLWITTHSLGVLRAAQELAVATPGSVSLIDFDGVEPDIAQELVPSNLGRVSWEKMLSIALDDLSDQLAPQAIIVCEGSSLGTRRKDFDAEIYNQILASRTNGVLFISGGASNQIKAARVSVKDALQMILPKAKVIALCDRDDKSQQEVDEFERDGGLVLPRRNLESYLFDDEVIDALVSSVGRPEMLSDALAVKRDAIAESVSRRNPPDDLKSAAGTLYVKLKSLLGLTQCGNDTDAFMRVTLAPLINPAMDVYKELQTCVIERI